MPTAVIASQRTHTSVMNGVEIAPSLVLHLAVCHVADAMGSSAEEAVLHSLVPRQSVIPGCQLV